MFKDHDCFKLFILFAFLCVVVTLLSNHFKHYYHHVNIVRVLTRDREVYDFIKKDADKLPNTPYKIRNYVAGLNNIDLSGCPIDFIEAFKDHIRAWNTLADYLEREHATVSLSLIKSALMGDINAILKRIIYLTSDTACNPAMEQQLMCLYWSWDQVINIAYKYGYTK